MAVLFVIAGILVAAIAGHAFLNGKPIQGMLAGVLAVYFFSRMNNEPIESPTDWLVITFSVVLIASATITFFSLERDKAADEQTITETEEKS